MWQVHTYYTSTVFKLKGIPGQYFQSKLPPFPCSTSTSLFQRSHHETWILLWILHKLNKKNTSQKTDDVSVFRWRAQRSRKKIQCEVVSCRVGFDWISGHFGGGFQTFSTGLGDVIWAHVLQFIQKHKQGENGTLYFLRFQLFVCVPAWNLSTHSILAKWNNISPT